ncbi:hypothetical protein [Thermococcus sp. MV11]|uniref:hypothetical protein n=1 Tax=Thermococcus sp. MV11 TaxID=1638267 RepID=UPI0014320A66|nr:hypothetical protein [Thermococcus sp. MV11]NJE04487.1 hypothetical protein [Thermococcus sp. MV11]
MTKLRISDELRSFASNMFTWSVLGFMSMDFHTGLLFGAGAAVAGTAKYVERYRDLLARSLGFAIMSLAIFLFRSDSWFRLFAVSFLAWVAIVYLIAYVLRVRYENDFLERNFLGVTAVGAISSFMLAYPSRGSSFVLVSYLFTSLAVLYLVYLVSSYVSSKRTGRREMGLLPLPDLEPRKDTYSRDLGRVVRAFVEKGDRAPLLVFIIRNSPKRLYDSHLEEIIRPVANYRESPVSPLAPPWLVEKKAEEEKERRALLVQELVKRLEAHGGIGKWNG